MSVDPTAYDEIQDQRLDNLDEIVTTDYLPPSGPEYSFPVPDEPLNQEQFQLLSLSDGNGIFDRGDYPYWLEGHGSNSETNAKNSMILKVGGLGKAEAVVAGFFHMMTEDKEIPLPAVSTETTYNICLTYDPRKDLERLGPVSIQVFTSAPPTTFARTSAVLYSVTRKPNQLLTDAKIERFRPRAVPAVSVLQRSHLPDPASVMFGSLGILYGDNDIVVARGASTDEGGPTRWDSITDPEWTNLTDNNYYGYPGHGYRRGYRQKGSTVQLRGRVRRVSGDNFLVGGSSNAAGYGIMTLPERLAPKQEQRFITATNNYSGQNFAVITVTETGNVYGTPVLGSATWMSFDGIEFSTEE